MAGLAELEDDLESGVREIKLPGGKGKSFTVRGLALSDISNLLRARSTDIEAFFVKFSQGQGTALVSGDPKYANQLATKFGSDLLGSAPDLAADIIAYASDEPTRAHIVRRLPFPVQIEALEAISELTFVEEETLKKVVATVTKFMAGTTDLLSDINQQRIGSMLSENGLAS